MKKSALALILLMMFLFVITFTSAIKVDENYEFCQTCENSNYVTLSKIQTPTGLEILDVNMTNVAAGSFCYNYTPTEIGIYEFNGVSDGCLKTFNEKVSVNIIATSPNVFAYIITIIFLILCFSGLVWINIKFDSKTREVLYNKIIGQYSKYDSSKNKSNLAYSILYFIGYAMLRMIFVFYYIFILLLMTVLTEFIVVYNINSLVPVMQNLLAVFLWGLIIVCVVFVAILYEVIKDLILEVSNNLRGAESGW